MMKTWKEIMADTATYGDDFTFTLKNGETINLGAARAYDKEHEGELTQRLTAKEQELAKREKQVTDASIGMASLLEKGASNAGMTTDQFIEALASGKAVTKKSVAAATELDENDPLVGTLVKELKGIKAELAEVRGGNEKLRKDALGPMLTTYLEDFYESRWEKIQSSIPKGAKVELKEALDYANKNGLKDQKGRFDLSKAVRDLTYDARIQEEAEKRVADLRKKEQDEQILAAVPKPNSLGAKVKTDKALLNDKGRTKSLDEVLNDAMQDTDLWRGIAQVQ